MDHTFTALVTSDRYRKGRREYRDGDDSSRGRNELNDMGPTPLGIKGDEVESYG